jgi:pimeloyl-ACP methyl ester carboxylesterase
VKLIRRAFCDLSDRQLHFRTRDGAGVPIVALHALPGSARQLEPVIAALDGRRVIAPDLAGLGDSDPHPDPAPQIADHARDMLALIDGLGLGTVDLYGTHTGAAVAVEMAIAAPDRVRRIVLDGMPLWEPDEARELFAHYPAEVELDLDGGHLLRMHNVCRDMLLFWPWYDKRAQAMRGVGLPSPRELHGWVIEAIKGMDAVPGGYRAGFSYPAASRLPLVSQPALYRRRGGLARRGLAADRAPARRRPCRRDRGRRGGPAAARQGCRRHDRLSGCGGLAPIDIQDSQEG